MTRISPLFFLTSKVTLSNRLTLNYACYSTVGQKKFRVSSNLKEKFNEKLIEEEVEHIVKTLDSKNPLETKTLFSISGYISNYFANFLKKKVNKPHNQEEIIDEPAYQNQSMETYELLRTPMTDYILNEIVKKDREHFIENVLIHEIKNNTTEVNNNKMYNYVLTNSQKKKLENISSMELSQLLDRRTVENRNYFLNALGFYDKDKEMLNKQAEQFIDHLLEHVGKFAENNIYEKTNLPNPGEYWVESELNLLNLHIWLVFRRLSFCYDGRDMMEMISKMYWKFVKVALENDVGVPSAQINKSLKKVQDHAYAMWFSLDEALQIDSPAQDYVLAEILMKYLYPIVEDVRMRDLHFWVRYLRFTQTYLDLVETPLFVRGAWKFRMPDSQMVLKVDGLQTSPSRTNIGEL